MSAVLPTVRVALIGAGMAGRAHANAYRSLPALFYPPVAQVELTLVADAYEPLAHETAQRFGFARVATSWEEVVEAKDVDAVSVVLPNHQHRQVVQALLEAGKHVLCEKPLAPTAAEAHLMLRMARRAGVVHAVGFNLRRVPALAALRQRIQGGDFGQPRHFVATYLTDYAASEETPFTWRYRRDLAGGGAVLDIGSHVVDLGRYLFGDVASVQGASMATFVQRRPIPAGHAVGHAKAETTGEYGEVDTDDVAAFAVRFSSGAVGSFSVNRMATGHRNSVALSLMGSRAAATFEVERMAEFGYFQAGVDEAFDGFRRVVSGPALPYLKDVLVMPVAGVGIGYAETFMANALEFVRAIATGQPLDGATFDDGYAAALVCEAAQRAAENDRAVPIREVAAEAELT